MKILCLYNNECAIELFQWIQEQGHETILYTEKLNTSWCREQQFDLTVSYTYRYIVMQDILQALNHNVVNIHNSYLPWNRGADPNVWSIVDDTPRGVTLHYMDTGLDKGSIIAQRLVGRETGETLRSSYEKLDKTAKELFQEAFAYYKDWSQMKKLPLDKGTYHSLRDGIAVKSIIDTYDLTIVEFKERLKRVLNMEREEKL